MTETLHNRPVDRDKLSAALKRNMARRKVVGKKTSAKPLNEPYVAKEAHSLKGEAS